MIRTLRSLRQTLELASGRAALHRSARRAEWRFPAAAESLLDGFRNDAAPTREAYASLYRYVMTGFIARRSPCSAHADYSGLDSYNGPAMDRLEGFSRTSPLAAAWMHGGRAATIALPGGERADIAAMLRAGLLAGTAPGSPEYWGSIAHWGQAIVEAADIALVLWLCRDGLWRELSAGERRQVGDWLLQVNGKRLPDNNWHLFVVQVNAVLAALGMPHDAEEMDRHYRRARSFYRGQGWFQDGESAEEPGFDFYNAWGFHYHLQWLRRIAPDFEGQFIDESMREFAGACKHFFSPRGFPMLGRSTCYRMAAPVPLVFAQQMHPDLVSPGEARRALDVTWQHFIRNGALVHGNVTQGYFGTDRRVVEPYSGPASCLWSLRSLVAAFAQSDDAPFWRCASEPLPVEKGDYRIALETPGWVLVGDRASGVVTIETGLEGSAPFEDTPLRERLLGLFLTKPLRPKNLDAKYRRARYLSTSIYLEGGDAPP